MLLQKEPKLQFNPCCKKETGCPWHVSEKRKYKTAVKCLNNLILENPILRSQMDIHPAAEYQASGLLSALASAA